MRRWNLNDLLGKWISPFIKRCSLGERMLRQFSMIAVEFQGKLWVWLNLLNLSFVGYENCGESLRDYRHLKDKQRGKKNLCEV